MGWKVDLIHPYRDQQHHALLPRIGRGQRVARGSQPHQRVGLGFRGPSVRRLLRRAFHPPHRRPGRQPRCRRPGGRPETEYSQRPGRGPPGAHLVDQPLECRQHRPQRGRGVGQPVGADGRSPARWQLHRQAGHLRHHHAQRHPGVHRPENPLRG